MPDGLRGGTNQSSISPQIGKVFQLSSQELPDSGGLGFLATSRIWRRSERAVRAAPEGRRWSAPLGQFRPRPLEGAPILGNCKIPLWVVELFVNLYSSERIRKPPVASAALWGQGLRPAFSAQGKMELFFRNRALRIRPESFGNREQPALERGNRESAVQMALKRLSVSAPTTSVNAKKQCWSSITADRRGEIL